MGPPQLTQLPPAIAMLLPVLLVTTQLFKMLTPACKVCLAVTLTLGLPLPTRSARLVRWDAIPTLMLLTLMALANIVPVCYYLPADYNSDSNAMGSSADSWAPVFVNLDEDNHMKTVNAMNRETIVVRIPQQQGLSNYSFDAPAGEGALLLQDHSSDSEYYT